MTDALSLSLSVSSSVTLLTQALTALRMLLLPPRFTTAAAVEGSDVAPAATPSRGYVAGPPMYPLFRGAACCSPDLFVYCCLELGNVAELELLSTTMLLVVSGMAVSSESIASIEGKLTRKEVMSRVGGCCCG